jgi:FkbM family methyltransferase
MSTSVSRFDYERYYQLGGWDKAQAFLALSFLRILGIAGRYKLGFVAPLLRRFKLTQTLRRGSRAIHVDIPVEHVELSIYNEIFLKNGYQMPFPLEEVESVLDIGANVGFATLYFFLQCPNVKRIVMVEANPQLMEKIRKNLSTAQVDAEVLTGVVSALPQPTIDFGIAGRHNSSRLLVAETADARQTALQFEKIVPVRNYSLASLLQTLDLDTVSLLKMDIEGAEIDILEKEAASLRAAKYICIELHGGPQVNQRLKNVLADNGFEIVSEPSRHPVVEQVFARNRNPAQPRALSQASARPEALDAARG